MNLALNITDEDINNVEELTRKLYTLASIVVRKHYYASTKERDDLISLGIIKALEMIHNGYFSASKGNLCTFLYTGIRNEMHNYLYHMNKFSTTDLSVLESVGEEEEFPEQNLEYAFVHMVCLPFEKSFGSSIEREVIKILYKLGYFVENTPKEVEVVEGYRKVDEGTMKAMASRITGIVLWKKREYQL